MVLVQAKEKNGEYQVGGQIFYLPQNLGSSVTLLLPVEGYANALNVGRDDDDLYEESFPPGVYYRPHCEWGYEVCQLNGIIIQADPRDGGAYVKVGQGEEVYISPKNWQSWAIRQILPEAPRPTTFHWSDWLVMEINQSEQVYLFGSNAEIIRVAGDDFDAIHKFSGDINSPLGDIIWAQGYYPESDCDGETADAVLKWEYGTLPPTVEAVSTIAGSIQNSFLYGASGNELPFDRPLEHYDSWTIEWTQFESIQAQISSGAEFSSDPSETVAWFHARAQRLADTPEEELQSFGYCRYGYFLDEEDFTLYLWYRTTSGTILVQAVKQESRTSEIEVMYEVFLQKPRSEVGRVHRQAIDLALQGMSKEMYYHWYSSELDNTMAYAEKVEFWEQHMVPLGYDPLEPALK